MEMAEMHNGNQFAFFGVQSFHHFTNMTFPRTKQNCLACWLLAMSLLLCIFASTAIILVETDHDCNGDDCPICQLIHAAKDTLTLNGPMPSQVTSTSFASLSSSSLPHFAQPTLPAASLVHLKIRLNN